MDVKAKVEKYAGQSRHYLLNASKFIDTGDSAKASEFLWGSMAQALKAVAANNGMFLRNHGRIWNFAESLTKELEDKSIYDAFSSNKATPDKPYQRIYDDIHQMDKDLFMDKYRDWYTYCDKSLSEFIDQVLEKYNEYNIAQVFIDKTDMILKMQENQIKI